MISFAIGGMGATDDVCVSGELIGGGGSAMRLSMRERKLDGDANE